MNNKSTAGNLIGGVTGSPVMRRQRKTKKVSASERDSNHLVNAVH